MNITRVEKEIIRAVNMEINRADEINFDGNDCYNATVELKDLRRFVKKCFKEHRGGEWWIIQLIAYCSQYLQ